jgi:hypothetical protein
MSKDILKIKKIQNMKKYHYLCNVFQIKFFDRKTHIRNITDTNA